MFNSNSPKSAECSFCGKPHNEVKKLIAGPGIMICNECVIICSDILDREIGVSRLVSFGDGQYNLDHLVAVTEVAEIPPPNSGWDTPKGGKELLLVFSEGISVRLPLSERERIEKLMLR